MEFIEKLIKCCVQNCENWEKKNCWNYKNTHRKTLRENFSYKKSVENCEKIVVDGKTPMAPFKYVWKVKKK